MENQINPENEPNFSNWKANLNKLLPDTKTLNLIGASVSISPEALHYDGKANGGAWVRACLLAKATKKRVITNA
jgi:hypothetical protein